MRVLLIEDDNQLASYLLKALGEVGMVVDRAADGKDGLFLAAGESYDVMIVDRMLPNLDGLSILRTLRASNNKTPVLILSALGEVNDRGCVLEEMTIWSSLFPSQSCMPDWRLCFDVAMQKPPRPN